MPWAQKSLLCALGTGAAPVAQLFISEGNETLGRTAVPLPLSCPLGTSPLRWDGPTAPVWIRLGKVGGENFSYVVFNFFSPVSPLPLYSLNLTKYNVFPRPRWTNGSQCDILSERECHLLLNLQLRTYGHWGSPPPSQTATKVP